jgi:predicted alpha-1,2-mannosidase
MKRTTFIFLFTLVSSVGLHAQKLIDYVNPFIGTGGHGHTYPGATVPFGMVQLSPDNGRGGWDWCSGYHYSDSVIQGFSHTHLSGTGIGDLCDISVMPFSNRKPDTTVFKSRFSHDQEKASPGYYAVHLKDDKVFAELTTSIRCGMHRYSFQPNTSPMIRFDLGFAINWDTPTETYFRKVDAQTFVGYRYSKGWAKDQKVYFAVKVNKPIKDLVMYADKKKINVVEAKGAAVLAHLIFDTLIAGEKIQMKVGLSFADIQGAIESLNEIPGWNFDEVKEYAESLWQRELGKIRIKTEDPTIKQIFYTSLYHTYQAPVIFSDRYGNYKGVKGDIQNGRMVMSIQSLWDTFRAANPLLTITQTELVPFIINSYLAFYDQYGLLPVWDLQFNETNTMTGYHAIPVITDAIMKGIKGFDYNKAYVAMKASAAQNIRGTDLYRQYGYVPQDLKGSSVTITLEYAFDDWCIAQVAKKLGFNADYREFMKRGTYWRNVFDRKRGFARPKDSKGNWVEPFDPFYSEHDENKAAYTEGNAWQHSWFVPQDPFGLINYLGGSSRFEKKLDSLFTISSEIKGDNKSPDISGLIGQYAHGNEPSHHIAYLYNYAGKPEKTAERVRKIMAELYTNKPDGLSGNEDCGQMSAWYVFSALGFYPVNPASGEYVLGSPLTEESVFVLPEGKVFRVVATGLSNQNIYIQSARLNGELYTRSSIFHKDIMEGGVLELQMGPKPSKTWGKGIEDLPGRARLR